VILEHAEWILFAWVFGNQAGVPLPVAPALLGAGALAANGHLSTAMIIAVAVAASLTADLTWYGLGRWHGARVLKTLGTFAPSAGGLVRRVQRVFTAHVGTFQLGARFLPELNAIGAGLAGASKVSVPRFVCFGAVSALAWASAWIGTGFLLSNAVSERAAQLGICLIVLFLAAFALYIPFHRVRRHRLIRVFRRARSSPHDLKAHLKHGAHASMLDRRATVEAGPGSKAVNLSLMGTKVGPADAPLEVGSAAKLRFCPPNGRALNVNGDDAHAELAPRSILQQAGSFPREGGLA
jgi:membrane protein DedA with SNARE-associated domain